MSEFAAGDIVVVPFPYTDGSAAKQRPALVLSNERFNATSPDVVACAITSNIRDSEYSVLIGPQDIETGTLKVASRAKVGNLAAIDKTVIRKKIGRVNARAFSQVMREFEAIFT